MCVPHVSLLLHLTIYPRYHCCAGLLNEYIFLRIINYVSIIICYVYVCGVESHTSLWLGVSQGTDSRPTSSIPAGNQHY